MDIRELLRQIQAGQAQYTPEYVAALRQYYQGIGGAALGSAERFIRTHDRPYPGDDYYLAGLFDNQPSMPAGKEDEQPSSSWENTEPGTYNV